MQDRADDLPDGEPVPPPDGVDREGGQLTQLGDFRILRLIGRGGMGVVYEAEQESLRRRVALKVLPAGALADPNQVRRFRREARAAARLHHTNIVPVFGVGSQDGHHYYVMQFIEGSGLDAVLVDLRRLRRASAGTEPVPGTPSTHPGAGTTADVARSLVAGRFDTDGPPPPGPETESFVTPAADAPPTMPIAVPTDATLKAPPPVVPSANGHLPAMPGAPARSTAHDPDRAYFRSVARIGIQVAEALDHAHRQGILHRDIKPSNLLLDGQGKVWVTDFGLAKTGDADDLTRTGDILGTIRYMAPERFEARCDARSDVYSLGLTLYELAALRPAFDATNRRAMMERVLHASPEPLRRLAPGVPRDLETIIGKAMAREPSKRYASAFALAEDLRRFVEDRPIRARRVTPIERLARWCRRDPWLASATFVAASALVLAATIAQIHAARQAEARDRIAGLADHLERQSRALTEERGRLRSALSESRSRLARLDLERGRVAFERGQIGVGLLRTVESLRMTAESGDADGRRVALATLAAWAPYLARLEQVVSHRDRVMAVAFAPDGRSFLTGSADRQARRWDAGSGQPIEPTLRLPDQVVSVAYSPDGRSLLTGGADGKARRWDAGTGRAIGPPLEHEGWVMSVAFAPDGRTLLTGGFDRIARRWDADTGRPLGPSLKHAGAVYQASYRPDGRVILTASADGQARRWDAGTGRPIGPPLGHGGLLTSAVYSPDGRIIATGSHDRTVRFWDDEAGRPVGPPLSYPARITSLAFHPDGRSILVGAQDRTATLRDVATGRPVGREMVHPGIVWDVAYGPGGRSILTAGADGSARLWDGGIGRAVGRPIDLGRGVEDLALRPDGRSFLTAGRSGMVRAWDLATGRPIGPPVELPTDIACLAISPDGRTIVTGGYDHLARTWDAETGRPAGPPLIHPDGILDVTFRPDGRAILTAGRDGAARIWDVDTGRRHDLRIFHRGPMTSAAFSPDGRTILTGSFDRTARLWDAATGRPIGAPMVHSDLVTSSAFSPDGRTVATGSLDDTARTWDAETGRPAGPPMAPAGPVVSLAYSPDGLTIATGSRDGRVRTWDAATGQPIGPAREHASSDSDFGPRVLFGPDGRSLLAFGPTSARAWDLPPAWPDDVERLSVWVGTATGLELDDRGAIRALDRDAWLERRRRLDRLGGPPPADPSPLLDPILCGDDPTARGDAWASRGDRGRAEAAYVEAADARPFDRTTWYVLAGFHRDGGHPDRAAATLAGAARLVPDDPEVGRDAVRAAMLAGDRDGWRRSIAALLDRSARTRHIPTALLVARACTLGPGGPDDPEAPIRLARFAVERAGQSRKPDALAALGAALYRAGRHEEALGPFEESRRRRGGTPAVEDWPFLAMVHHRLGHRDEAIRWLDRLRDHRPASGPSPSWDEVEVELLRDEAEALIRLDPRFPDDPFAP